MTSNQTVAIKFGDLTVFYDKRANNKLPSTLNGVSEASDLKPGIYEGGFKIWECSIDLCRFLVNSERIQLKDKRVLELGCGAGLPGIVALKRNAKHVSFQDYNDEVINLWTRVNVDLNSQDAIDCLSASCSYIVGDWDQARTTIATLEEKFDVVISSETIYNTENYGKLLSIIDESLTDDGCAFVAAKAYYFGVGGSVDSFLDFVNADKPFRAEIVWTSASAAISRHILLLRRA